MKKNSKTDLFAHTILTWFDQHGRKNLPWQKNITPYRVWISEIMLQQTQVKTVLSYFDRFIKRFPTLKKLADAPLEEILQLWSGLGYYSRARNLHRCAQIIMESHQGKFPDDIETLKKLPGIGRSTAGAIVAIAYQKRAAILDGNVKRVLTRAHAIAGWPGDKNIEKQLWQIAEQHTPAIRIADYTQAMMDLGAMICTRSKPKCTMCPLQSCCIAYQNDSIAHFPERKLSQPLPIRAKQFLILQHGNKILLEKRPPTGIWGGLWSLPECELQEEISIWCKKYYGLQIKNLLTWPSFRHTFTHFHLDITPIQIFVKNSTMQCMESKPIVWYNLENPEPVAFSAVMKRILQLLQQKI